MLSIKHLEGKVGIEPTIPKLQFGSLTTWILTQYRKAVFIQQKEYKKNNKNDHSWTRTSIPKPRCNGYPTLYPIKLYGHNGARTRTWTQNLVITKHLHYQLCYSSIFNQSYSLTRLQIVFLTLIYYKHLLFSHQRVQSLRGSDRLSFCTQIRT